MNHFRSTLSKVSIAQPDIRDDTVPIEDVGQQHLVFRVKKWLLHIGGILFCYVE